MTGAGGAWVRVNGVRESLDGGRAEGEVNSCAAGTGLNACSKLRSVREIRRDSL
jgi:hypothetical protein